ncbi:MAG TPA: hypothetical protein VHB27_08085 [Rhodopila sp.]|uniref:hypothetical protein n=1 Tax=Rhodopila sp. TaxID=2480087 RepID=UPI002D145196|nr:hypothetical protein [Rhodopila sp.]HVY15170.1 hypothetical protein [Rhodopila sp.]
MSIVKSNRIFGIGVVTTVISEHVASHGTRETLLRHEKMPQIRHFGEFLSDNAGQFDRIDGDLLPTEPQA